MENNGYEKSDVKLGKIVFWGMTASIILVVLVLLSLDYFKVTQEELVYDMVLKPESEKLIELRVKENEELTTYALIDTANNIYRIPIEEAMRLIVEEANNNNSASSR
jgi:hypothetical protein